MMAKYIKLEDLMKFPIRLDHYDKEHGDVNFIYGIETVLEYAENLQTTDVAQEWIPVTEKLPEDSATVLVCHKNGIVTTNAWLGAHWWFENERNPINHWMPLPEPPKGEGL